MGSFLRTGFEPTSSRSADQYLRACRPALASKMSSNYMRPCRTSTRKTTTGTREYYLFGFSVLTCLDAGLMFFHFEIPRSFSYLWGRMRAKPEKTKRKCMVLTVRLYTKSCRTTMKMRMKASLNCAFTRYCLLSPRINPCGVNFHKVLCINFVFPKLKVSLPRIQSSSQTIFLSCYLTL